VGYEVRIISTAEREMDRLTAAVHKRISRRILTLEDNPRLRGAQKLSGREEYRLRIGDYRVIPLMTKMEWLLSLPWVTGGGYTVERWA
jgi:mRNA interferase RelE/StbE